MTERAGLRRDLRNARRALDAASRIDAALSIAAHLSNAVLTRRYTRIGAFVAADGEADPGPFIAAARDRGRDIFLPVLDPLRAAGLRFVRTESGQALFPNRYGIPEPRSGLAVAARFLDLVLVPLVGFDDLGHRLGMGAGYYDRSFAYLNTRTRWRKPRLVGVAYECQRVARIEPAPWDVPLDGVVTESGFKWFEE